MALNIACEDGSHGKIVHLRERSATTAPPSATATPRTPYQSLATSPFSPVTPHSFLEGGTRSIASTPRTAVFDEKFVLTSPRGENLLSFLKKSITSPSPRVMSPTRENPFSAAFAAASSSKDSSSAGGLLMTPPTPSSTLGSASDAAAATSGDAAALGTLDNLLRQYQKRRRDVIITFLLDRERRKPAFGSWRVNTFGSDEFGEDIINIVMDYLTSPEIEVWSNKLLGWNEYSDSAHSYVRARSQTSIEHLPSSTPSSPSTPGFRSILKDEQSQHGSLSPKAMRTPRVIQ